jgi:hypothetical protein
MPDEGFRLYDSLYRPISPPMALISKVCKIVLLLRGEVGEVFT